MKNPIKQFTAWLKARRANRENIQWLKTVAQQHQWLDQLRTANLLQWDVVQHRLFIEADLAVLFLQNADRWTAFIHNTYLWLYYNLAQQATEDYFHQEELRAVREHLSKTPDLTRADIDRIRRNRRAEIMQSDVPIPQIEDFEFFIVRPDAVSTATGQATGRLIAVGHYDPATEQMEIASWEEVQPLLQKPDGHD